MPPRLERAGKIDSAARARAKLEIMENAYRALKQRQSPYKTLLGSLLGAVLALIAFVMIAAADTGMVFLYLLPPALIGLGARIIGQCFDWQLLLIPVASATCVYLTVFGYLLPFHSADLIVVPLGVALAAFLARKPLSDLEKKALWQAKLGKFD
ncbi:hypothetical protein [Shewanella litorisediminis]|uniref:Uncharacterized protein n=1 Tax=Shewanella litorisediminis TaxID=1173586 RepID=A0ABX7G146_9GAMM|nr:hypothetical protein [Shewanella litorisediminis]MCL2918922.1 hypothetical protein [Shewanella litorisediminis]QRH00993.1 hypothetical protein JQC75_14140 [Shewanella litorisediminis]